MLLNWIIYLNVFLNYQLLTIIINYKLYIIEINI